ncbi:MAG: MATE family efflux transporter [Rhodospirillaceae bacterium]|nr:MATE family efflux transporter [Rhodospirillaceae bacterium]
MATPNMIAMFVTLLTFVAEAWYVGQLGTVSLAGLALAFPMMMLTMMLSAGSIGGSITGAVAQRLGAGNRSEAETLAVHAVLLTVLLAAVSALVFVGGGGLIYSVLGGSGAVLEQALAYSDVLFYGCVSVWLANGLAAIVRATGQMKIAAKNLVAGSIVQVIAAAVLIFGLGPFPNMGIAGAAAGIVIGQAVASALLLYYLMARCSELRLRLLAIPIKLAPMAAILKVGALSSVNSFCSLAAIIVITGFMARHGVDVLAGYGIGARLEFLIIPLIFGFGAASTALVGVHFGAGEIKRAHRVGWTAALYSAGLTGLIGVLVAIFPDLWANLFSDVEAVRAACRAYLQIVGPFYAFFGMALCLYFASLGSGRVLWPVLAVILRVAVVTAGCIYLSSGESAGIEQFYWLIAVGIVTQAFVTGAAVKLGAWTRGLN